MNKRRKSKKLVFVGMSGGVDSSVSAALLKKDFSVVGVFIKVWSPPESWGVPCTWREDRRDAMRVCAQLDIPFVTLDLEKEYKREVVDYMISEYKAGRTPNPDVMCNKEIKFGSFYDFALKNGADFVATGHYAQINEGTIFESSDKTKEQSYFVWNIKKEQIPRILFPIGRMQKSQVRVLAKKFKLPNSEKKDSQGLCFLGKVDMKEFLTHFIKEKPGKVLDTKGAVIGEHDGTMFLTIGQRHGFKARNKKTFSKPLYVIAKNIKQNTITVSDLKPAEGSGKKKYPLIQTNWLVKPEGSKLYDVRFRYHQRPLKARVLKEGGNWLVDLEAPFGPISAGQSAVIYDREKMVGGGVVK